jgi:hypothetical protein
MAISYNATSEAPLYIYRATGGGVTFSANLTSSSATMDYFTDTAVVNDAIYFSRGTTYPYFSDLIFNVGTAMAGTGITLVWEYYGTTANAWVTMENLVDDTNSFTTTGSNRVKFPIQLTHKLVTVNGKSSTWVRVRMSAKTTITEGGKNQTDAVTCSTGFMSVDGYTDEVPCSWDECYNYMNTNYPYVGCLKNGNYFDFRRVIPRINSRLVSKNEVVEMGADMTGNAVSRLGIVLNYLTSGDVNPSDPTRGKDGSVYIMNGVINSYPYSWGDNHKSYGTTWRNPTVYTAGQAGSVGYPTIQGTFVDSVIQAVPSPPNASAIVTNSRIELYTGFIAASFAGATNFTNNTIVLTQNTGQLFSLYQGSWTLRNLNYVFNSATGARICGFAQSADNNLEWNFINPLKRLPGSDGTTNYPIYAVDSTATNMPNVFFYDASADTFTDYTSQASSAGTGDVPIHGDVGDMIYLNMQNATTVNYHPFITSTIGGTNDYVYKWEYYQDGSWKEFTRGNWDLTSNLTKTGMWYFARTFNSFSTVTINGVPGYYYRMTIVTKGTGTPSVDKIQRKTRYGVCNWKMNEKYDIEFTGVDDTSTPLEGVEVCLEDAYGTTQFTGTSGVDGTITPAEVLDRQWFWDPFDPARNTTTDIVEKSFNPYTTKVRKYGYVSQEFITVVQAVQKMNVMLMDNTYVSVDKATASAYTGISVDGVTNTITISEDHTMQEVYDYCEDWASLTANMGYNEPFVTTDGQNFTSTYDLVLDNCALTGTGRISIVVNTVTYIGTATSTLDIVAVDGTHTNIKLTGLTAGSRVQLYDEDTTTELYNDVVAATSLTFPIVWTTDTNIRIRVSYVDGVTAKAWYETNATLTNNGINLAINQEDDDVYNAIGIDGSTVTECSIIGSTMVINVDDADNKSTWQRAYSFEVAWLFTEDGIRDQELFINATDSTHFTYLGGLKVKNLKTDPLEMAGGLAVDENGDAMGVFDLTGGAIFSSYPNVVGFPYTSNPQSPDILVAYTLGDE